METRDCIITRRSRRKFIKKEVPDNIILKLIDAARHAPFGGPPIAECQPWEFIVIRDINTKKQLSHSFRSKDSEPLMNCSALICVCGDTSKDKKYNDYEAVCSLATENLLLAAHDLGLGAFYMTTYNHNQEHISDRENFVKTLKLPSHIRLIALIPVGYPDDSEIIPEKELRDVKEIVHWDFW